MKKLRIITDSMAHIPEALCQEYDIHVIPLPYVWDNHTYYDFDMGPREFYTRLRKARTIPKTSGPPPALFKEKIDSINKSGDEILIITVGKVFSSTFKAANIAKDMCPDADVSVVSSDSNTMALGFQVLAAARAAKAGKKRKEVLTILNNLKKTSGVIFAAPNVKYLRQGGRIGHIQYFFSSFLNLIPILEIRNSPIEPLDRVRRNSRVLKRILELVSEKVNEERPRRMAVVHADNESAAWELAREARSRFEPDELITAELTPVLGIHAGPDAVGLAYSSGY